MIKNSNNCYLNTLNMPQHHSEFRRNLRIKTVINNSSQTKKSRSFQSLQNKIDSWNLKNSVQKLLSLSKKQKKQNRALTSFKTSGNLKKTILREKHEYISQKSLVFHLMDRCNNQQLISRLLQQRGRWTKNQGKFIGDVDFIWGYVNLPQLSRLKGKEMLSRVKGSNQMTDKGNLYQNLTKYSEKNNINLNFLPITFHLNKDGPLYSLKENIKEFVEFFNYVQTHTNLSNTWIMKPTNLNQGRDIHLFNTLFSLKNLLKGKIPNFQPEKIHSETDIRNKDIEKVIEEYVRINNSLIIQKYVQNPLLLQGHKFDIRMWVLMDHLKQFYIFEEGYLRFTSQPYKLNSQTLTDNYMHLTNHSLQKYSPQYSKMHSIQSMSVLKRYLKDKNKIIQKIKQIVKITMNACFNIQRQRKTKNTCFQVFGFDFLIDRELNVRLIEANCNPAITEDCPLLQELIPKMMNDAFKLTIDKIFNTKNSSLYFVPRLSTENAWILIGNIE